MTKVALRKAIIKRSELGRKYVKNKTGENSKSYRKQINFYSKLYKKERKKYYEILENCKTIFAGQNYHFPKKTIGRKR